MIRPTLICLALALAFTASGGPEPAPPQAGRGPGQKSQKGSTPKIRGTALAQKAGSSGTAAGKGSAPSLSGSDKPKVQQPAEPATLMSIRVLDPRENEPGHVVKVRSIMVRVKGVPASAVAQAIFDQIRTSDGGLSVFCGEPVGSQAVTFQEIIPIDPALGDRRYDFLLAKMRAVLGVVVVPVPNEPRKWFVSSDGGASKPSAPSSKDPEKATDAVSSGSDTATDMASANAKKSKAKLDEGTGAGGENGASQPKSAANSGAPAPASPEFIRVWRQGNGYALNASNTRAERLVEALGFLGANLGALGDHADGGRLRGSPFAGGALTLPGPAYGGDVDELANALATKLLGTVADSPVVTAWPVTFVRATIPKPEDEGASDPTATDAFMAKVAETVQAIDPTHGLQVKPLGTRLVLTGPQSTVEVARRLLAQWVDIPYSQVRLDFYMLQGVSRVGNRGERGRVLNTVQAIRKGAELNRAVQIFLTDALSHQVQELTPQELGLASTSISEESDKTGVTNLAQLMRLAGCDPNPKRSLSLAEVMVFLTLLPVERRAKLFDDARLEAKSRFEALVNDLTDDSKLTDESRALKDLASLYKTKLSNSTVQLFPRVLAAYGEKKDGIQQSSNRRLVVQFMKFWAVSLDYDNLKADYAFGLPAQMVGPRAGRFVGSPPPGGLPALDEKTFHDLLYDIDLPAKLTQASSAADTGLKNVVGALSDDMEGICMTPLLDWSNKLNAKAKTSEPYGVQLVGRTRMVVTAGQGAVLSTTAQTALPSRPSLDLSGVLTNAGTLATTVAGLEGLSDKKRNQLLPALLLAAGLGAPSTTYNTLTPSVSIGVRPSVLKDDGSARLQLYLNVAVDSTRDATDSRPYSQTKTQTITSDVTVNALDLFEMSSTNLQVSGPGGYSWGLGPLQYVPLLGNLFHGPTKGKTTDFDTIVLTRVTILPRTLDLAGSYIH